MNENYEVLEGEVEEAIENVKPTFKDRIKKIPVKKVLKVAGIAAGAIVGTVILGKVVNPDTDYSDESDSFDADYTEVSDET